MTLIYSSVETLDSPIQIGGQADITITTNTAHTTTKHHAAWTQYADDLAAWVERVQIRDDYAEWDKGWKCKKQKTNPIAMKLRGHFSGFLTLGMYTTHPERQTCKFFGMDIDAHDGQDVDVVANWWFALRSFNELRAMGLHPLLEDSNGKGGYHVWVLFDNEVSAKYLYALGRWLSQFAPNGVHVETFPKQPMIMANGYGNQMRLPGKHHKSQHWSGIYDGQKGDLVYDMEAIQLILDCPLSNADNIPPHVLQYVETRTPTPTTNNTPNNTQDNQTAGDWMTAYSGDLKTLDIEKLCEDRIAGRSSNGFIDIVCPWHEEHTTGENLAGIAKQDDAYPVFSCLHAHCKDRKLRELLAFYGVEAVNKCCEKQYGGAERLPDATELDNLITPFDLPDDDTSPNVTPTHNPPVSLVDPFIDDERPYVAKENPRGVENTTFAFAKLLSCKELDEMDLRVDYLIDSVLAKGQPCVVGGKSKTLKTSIVIDAVISLGTGLPFLNRFATQKVPVAMWSGESGLPTIQETARRIARSKGVALQDVDAWWCASIPRLSIDEQLVHFEQTLKDNGIQVAIIDPLYLSLLGQQTAGSAGNLFAMGAALLPITEIGQRLGCTIVTLHHYRKTGADDNSNPCQLDDLSQSGIAEWARQWILLQRREHYKDDGTHKLWIRMGGSAGHASLWGLDIDEGKTIDNTRRWQMSLFSQAETLDRLRQNKLVVKDEQARLADDRTKQDVLEYLGEQSLPVTLTPIQQSVGGKWERLKRLIINLVDEGKLSAHKKGKYDYYALSTNDNQGSNAI